MKNGGDPASSWSDCDLSLPGVSKMSSQLTSLVGTKERICIGTLKVTNISNE